MMDSTSAQDSLPVPPSPPPRLHLFNGLVMPDFVQQETFDKLKDLPLRSDDVWIVTYPKAGTTWTQQIVRLLRSTSQADREEKISDAVPWLEGLSFSSNRTYEDVKADRRPRAFKSHMPYEMMPCGLPDTTQCKYIYVARNPKDVIVSYYFHLNAYGQKLSWEMLWSGFVNKKLPFGDYFDHVLGWWAHKDDENVLFLKYEDMKKDLFAAVANITTFIGCNVSQKVIDEVVFKTSFESMKDDSTTNYTWDKIRDPNAEKPFMRKGEVGDWVNYLTPEQSAQIDKLSECCSKVGLYFDF